MKKLLVLTGIILFSLLMACIEITAGTENLTESEKCKTLYQEILDKEGSDFSRCYGDVKEIDCGSAKEIKTQINLVVILDASGSMACLKKEKSKMDIGKDAVLNFIAALRKDINFALVVYGQNGNNKKDDKATLCKSIETVYPMQKINPQAIEVQLNKLRPAGLRPMEKSLRVAFGILRSHGGDNIKNIILLISSGKETCGRAPATIAEKLYYMDARVITNVIGFDVDSDAEKQLKNIAKMGKGKYLPARSHDELNAAFAKLAAMNCMKGKNASPLDTYFSSELSMANCIGSLTIEKKAVLMEIGLIENEQCMDYCLKRYKERYYSIKYQLREIYLQSKEEIKKKKDPSIISKFDKFFNFDADDFIEKNENEDELKADDGETEDDNSEEVDDVGVDD